MKVDCENCHVKINLPDDKLVPGESFNFTCPKCKTKNTVQIPGQSQELAEPEEPSETEAADDEEYTDEADDAASEYDDDDDSEGGGGFYEEGAKVALICFDEGDALDNLENAMIDLGYIAVIAESTRDALSRLRVTQFHAVLLHQGFDGNEDEIHPIHRFIQPMNMSTRRYIFFALFGDNYKSGDQMMAYKLSVNAVVSMDDENIFHKIIKRSMADYERFYKVYFDISRSIA